MLVAVAVLIEITWLVARVLMMLSGNLLLVLFVAVAVLIEITWLVIGMIMMWAGLFLNHFSLLMDAIHRTAGNGAGAQV